MGRVVQFHLGNRALQLVNYSTFQMVMQWNIGLKRCQSRLFKAVCQRPNRWHWQHLNKMHSMSMILNLCSSQFWLCIIQLMTTCQYRYFLINGVFGEIVHLGSMFGCRGAQNTRKDEVNKSTKTCVRRSDRFAPNLVNLPPFATYVLFPKRSRFLLKIDLLTNEDWTQDSEMGVYP